MTLIDGTLTLDRTALADTIGALRDALDFLVHAVAGPESCSPGHARLGALSLHRAACGLANLADQAEAAAAPTAAVVDLAQVRRHQRHVRRTRPTLTGAPR